MSRRRLRIFIIGLLGMLCICVTARLAFAIEKTSKTPDVVAQATGDVTRAEWLSRLVDTFEMTIDEPEDYPEDYFIDLESSHEHYDDIMLATDFGVIDTPAGEKLHPDDPATREFAAVTLNYCLGYQLDEDADYTYEEAKDVSDAGDLQVAVNRKWFALSGGKVLPDQPITSAEADAMITDAQAVQAGLEELFAQPNEVVLSDGIKEIDKGTKWALSADRTTVTIEDCPFEIVQGDRFAMYSGDVPAVFDANEVVRDGSTTTVAVTEVDADEAYANFVYSGEQELDVEDFQEADGVSSQHYQSLEDAAAGGVDTGGYTTEGLAAQGVTYKNGTLSYSASVGSGSVTGSITSMKVRLVADKLKGHYSATLSGVASIKAALSGSGSVGVPLGYVTDGVWHASFSVVSEASGSISQTVASDFKVGYEYDRTNGFRQVLSFKKRKPSLSVTANARVGLQAEVGGGIKKLLDANLGAAIGFEANYNMDVADDGKAPRVCNDLEAHMFAKAYAQAEITLGPVKKEYNYDTIIWNVNNSPVRMHRHIEDGKEVISCTRGRKYHYGRWGSKWGRLMNGSSDTSGDYGDDGEWVEYAIYEYELDEDNNAIITKYHGNTRALIVPDTLDDHMVVGIASDAFAENGYLTSLVISENVRRIESSAFARCETLETVLLPSKLKVLGCGAFDECTALVSVNIPKDVSTGEHCGNIGYPGPFSGCTELRDVRFANGTTRIADGLFLNCGLESVTLPDTLTTIGWVSFADCEKLRTVVWNKGLTTIRSEAFADCVALEGVNLPDATTLLDCRAFAGCTGLKEVRIPKNLKTHEYCGERAYHGPFEGCSGDTKVTIVDGMPAIPNGLFWGFTGLAEVEIPTSVTSIGWRSFQGTTSLKKLTIPDSVTSISDSAFLGSGLTEIVVPDTVTSIGKYVFDSCEHLTKATIPSTLKELPDGLFSGSGLEEFAIPDSVSTLAPEVFCDCASLKKVDWGKKLQIINGSAFKNCSSLTEAVFPDTVWALDASAFENCGALTKVSFVSRYPAAMRSKAFENCDALTEVTLGLSLTKIPSDAFRHCDALERIVIPGRVTEIGENAFGECVKLSEVTIPKSVTNIDDSVFSYPEKMTIYGVAGSVAETWASEHGAKFVAIEKPATSVSFNKTEMTVFSGDEFYLTPNVEPVDCTDDMVWKTSNADIVSLDEDEEGTLHAYDPGKATIKFAVGDLVATCKVTVVRPVQWVYIDGDGDELDCGDTMQLTARADPSDAHDTSIEWSSSDESVATVDQNGLVSALKAGTVDIKATAKDRGTRYDTYRIYVRDMTIVTSVDQLESAHPYAKNSNLAWRYTVSGASSLAVEFDERTMLEEDGEDRLVIFDAEGREVGTWHGAELAGKTVTVPGDTLKIRLVSDGAINDWGFKVVSVTADGTNPQKVDLADCTVTLLEDNFVYDGEAKEPAVEVRHGDEVLVEGTDYSVSYDNNVEVGTGSVAVSGQGDYTGSQVISFAIVEPQKIDLSACDIALSQTSFVFDGEAKEPVVAVTYDGQVLEEGTDYTLTYQNNVGPGAASVVVTGIGVYAGAREASFEIEEPQTHDLSECDAHLSRNTFPYDGTAKEPTVVVKYERRPLAPGTDYTVTYDNNVEIGIATATVTGAGNYTGSLTLEFTIEDPGVNPVEGDFEIEGGRLIRYLGEDANIVVPDGVTSIAPNAFSGLAANANATIVLPDSVITIEDEAFSNLDGLASIQLSQNLESIGECAFCNCENLTSIELPNGLASIGYSAFEGSGLTTLTIPASVTSVGSFAFCDCASLASIAFLGSAPTFDACCFSGVTATVSHPENDASWTKEVCESLVGNLSWTTGEDDGPTDLALCSAQLGKNSFVYTGKAIRPTVAVFDGDRALAEGVDYTVAYAANTNAGKATVTVTGKGNYTGTMKLRFNILAANIAQAGVRLANTSATYTGKAIQPVVSVGKAAKSDYTVSYKNNVNIGIATVTVQGKGNFAGTVNLTFKILPGKAALKKVKTGKQKATVYIKSQKGGVRYQVAYRLGSGKWKTVKASKTNATIKKLKGKKTYSFRVRAFKKVGKETYYGVWSSAKTGTIKK